MLFALTIWNESPAIEMAPAMVLSLPELATPGVIAMIMSNPFTWLDFVPTLMME